MVDIRVGHCFVFGVSGVLAGTWLFQKFRAKFDEVMGGGWWRCEERALQLGTLCARSEVSFNVVYVLLLMYHKLEMPCSEKSKVRFLGILVRQ